jgi:hypothetical protein
MEYSLFEKLAVAELVKKLSCIHGSQKFVIVFPGFRHLSDPEPDESNP